MLYEFKSRATGSVVMTQKVAERLLQIIGKPTGPTGIILPEQMPAALAALQHEIDAERQAANPKQLEQDEQEALDRGRPIPVSLAQRAWPLIDMLRAAQAADKEITWGV
jgi:hypothetical protein